MKNAEWSPETLLEKSGRYWETCALHAAVQLDVFTVMEDQRLSAEAVAEKLQADPRALAMLLNALTAMNLLEKSGGNYFFPFLIYIHFHKLIQTKIIYYENSNCNIIMRYFCILLEKG